MKEDKIVSGGFELVTTQLKGDALGNGKYRRLVNDFVDNAQRGDFMEILHSNGEPLTEKELHRLYNGIRQNLRYRQVKLNEEPPVKIYKQGGKVYLEKLGE